MSRESRLIALVTLPTTTAEGTVALTEALHERAAGAAVPPALRAQLDTTLVELDALKAALQAERRLVAADARPARSTLLAAWTALRSAVAAHVGLPAHPVPARATSAVELDRALFGDEGLAAFGATTHEEAFGTSSTLLGVVESPDGAKHLATLGIPEFATSIRAAHDAFGRAAGIIAPPEAAPDIRAPYDRLRDELRRYLGRVIAWADLDPANEPLADALLQPWAEWESTAAAKDPAEPLEAAPASGGAGPDGASGDLTDLDPDEGRRRPL